MSIDAQQMLSLAEELQAHAGEPAWRGAISRAYYAAFHHANKWHSDLPSPGALPEKSGGVHHDLAGCLIDPTISKEDARYNASRSAGYLLRIAHKNRVKADYAISDNVSQQETQQAVLQSGKIIGVLC